MARRSSSPSSPRRASRAPKVARPRRRLLLPLVGALAAGGVAIGVWAFSRETPERLRDRAEAEARSGDWAAALRDYRSFNGTRLANGRTHLAEARACLALDRAAQAERALRRAIAADPVDPEPWRLLLELLRVEDRTPEALRSGWEAYAAVLPRARRGVLRDLTLALLADLPEDLARPMLDRWLLADPEDVDARVAQLRRIAAMPRAGDPDRDSRIATLAALVARDPKNLDAREALVTALADAGESERGRQVLDAWPPEARNDPRYARLEGHWALDYDHQAGRAAESFRHVLSSLPHDWKTQYRLARAYQSLGRPAEARFAAESVLRLRETLDSATLGPRLGADLARLDDPRSLLDLADLCARVGLTRLADAWRLEARTPPESPEPGQPDLGILDPSTMSPGVKPR